MKQKILLVNPVTRRGPRVLRTERCQQKILPAVGLWPPMTLLEIASFLKNRCFQQVKIIDGEVENISFQKLVADVQKYKPAMVVLQNTTPTLDDDLCFASKIKEEISDAVIVFVGLHASVFPEELLRHECVDYAIIGEPGRIVGELAEYLFAQKGFLEHIAGLGYKIGATSFVNPRKPSLANEDCPLLPDRSLLKNQRYILPLTQRPFAVIKVSRGCDFACSFCTSAAYYGHGWRPRNINSIIEEIDDSKQRFGIDTFLFLSDTFNARKDFVDQLCLRLIEKKMDIKWAANSRVDLTNEESVELMKRAGCFLIALGLESYNASALKKCGKNIEPAIFERALQIYRKNGILTYGYFILGLNGETPKTLWKTIRLARQSSLDFAHFYTLTPFPGTAYFSFFGRQHWHRYFHGVSDIVEYKNLSSQAIKLFRALGFFVFYSHPKRLRSLLLFALKGRLC